MAKKTKAKRKLKKAIRPKKLKSKRQYKKKVLAKNRSSYWRYTGVFLGIITLIAGFWLIKKPVVKKQSLSAPISYLIASLSAQNQPIKIDPQFSYTQVNIQNNSPERIIIPSLNIDLPVVGAAIIDGFWQTSTDSASFGLGSAYPGKAGNTVVFAHALENLFANLGYIQPEASIYLLTKNKWFNYKVKSVRTVLPTEIEVIAPTNDKTLTLYTCAGFGDVYRFVVTAKASK